MDQPEVQQRIEALVSLLKKNGTIRSAPVEQAFRTVPRHIFLPKEPLDLVYSDVAIAVKRSEEGRWTSSSSQPSMMAIMLEQLDLRPGMRVLEIGAGTGFNAALMAAIVGPQGRVTTIDVQPDLVEAARSYLATAGFPHVQAIAADGGYGYPEGAPYDRIILTVASHIITPAWREQLVPGGRLVLPLELGTQKSIAFEKQGEELHSVSITDCGFMVLQGAFARPEPVRAVIGPDPRLYLLSPSPLPFDPSDFAAWLERPAHDLPTGVTASVWDLWFGLAAWNLQYEGPNWSPATLQAEGEISERETLPRLSGFQYDENKNAFSTLQLDPQGAAALIAPPGQPFQFVQMNRSEEEEHVHAAPIAVMVRQYGQGEAAAQRLLRAVQEWNQAGKPGSKAMRVRAVPEEMNAQPEEGENLVDRRYTQFFIRFSKRQ